MDIKDASAYFNLGVAYVRQGKLDKAIEALQRSIELAPDDVHAYNNLDEAIEAYENAEEL